MAQRQISFLVVLFLMFSAKISGQEIVMGLTTPRPSMSVIYKNKFLYSTTLTAPRISGEEKVSQDKPIISLKIIAPSYYSSNLGFICKKELQLDKVVAIPLRFRLGSLAYVNYLEQKPNALNPLR